MRRGERWAAGDSCEPDVGSGSTPADVPVLDIHEIAVILSSARAAGAATAPITMFGVSHERR